MAIQVKVQKLKRKGQPDKWYGKTVKRQDVTLKDIAEIISKSNSVTASDVYGVLIALVHEMTFSCKWDIPSSWMDLAISI